MYAACGSDVSLVGYQHGGTLAKECFFPIIKCESTAQHKLKLSASQVHSPEFHLQRWGGGEHTKYAHSQWKVGQGPKLEPFQAEGRQLEGPCGLGETHH